MAFTDDPTTPPDLAARRKRSGWKPDAAGRLLFRPKGLFGAAYVVETPEQLARVERLERRKAIWMVMVGGAAIAVVLRPTDGTDDAGVLGAIAVVLALVAGLVGYSLVGGTRVIRDTAMRRRR